MGTIDPPSNAQPADLTETSPAYIGPRRHVYEHAESSLWFAFLINIVIGGIKFLAWVISGSPSVFSESLHSFGDGVNSMALILGNKFSRRPPDRTHPFGYGLEANVWALAACVFLIGTSAGAISEGVQHWNTPPTGDNAEGFLLSVGVLLVSIVLEIFAVRRAGQAVMEEARIAPEGFFESIILPFRHWRHVVSPTTRFVFIEDGIALIGALLALSAISISHFSVDWGILPPAWAHRPDAFVSIVIGLLLAVMAIYLFLHNRGILTQSSASPKIETRITELVEQSDGVSKVLDLKTVDHGLGGLTVHLQVNVDPYIQVKDVDDLTERLKEKIQRYIHQVSQVFVEVLADESEIEWSEKFNTLIAQGREEGVLQPRDEILLKNAYDFMEATIRDIMIPRIDVECVEVSTPLSQVADLMIETGYSRLPVFRENVDDLVGMVHARDVFAQIRHNHLDAPLAELVREIDIYPENKPVGDLLEDFRRKRISIAAVADEHGGFAGLVSVKDVIEEIIGDIWDEHKDEEPMLTFLSENRALVSGRCEIEELNKQLDLVMPFDDFKTVGGYVFGALGREPEQGDEVHFEDLKLTVTEVDGPRIVSVLLESPVPFENMQGRSSAEGDGNGRNTGEKERKEAR